MTLRFEVRPLDDVLMHLFVAPPAYTRLEPQSIAGDPKPGLEAAVHDPLWSLLRQWQFGEFAGEDAGQPLSARLAWTSAAVDAYAVGPLKAGATARGLGLGKGELLDPLVEAVGQGGPPDLRARADGGALLQAMFADVGFTPSPSLAETYPFAGAEIIAAPAWLKPVLRTKPDGAMVAATLRQAKEPQWLGTAPPAARDAATAWLAWYGHSIESATNASAWTRECLEYQFGLGLSDDAGKHHALAATEHLGGSIEWWSFNEVAGASIDVPGRVDGAASPSPDLAHAPLDVPAHQFIPTSTKLIQPLRFAGMPADRLWEFEDATVNLGAMDVQVNDPARLCLIEFASVYGADWFQIPLDVAPAALTTVTSLTVTDTFGETFTIKPASDLAGRFRLYEMSSGDPADDPTVHGLLSVPSAALTMEGPASETIHFVRDEMANMVWAIEETVSGSDGRARRRSEELRPPKPARPPMMAGAEIRYTLESDVPLYWIPFVPIQDGKGGFFLRKGTMSGSDDSASQLIRGRPVDIWDAEVPSDGLRVQRIPALSRAADGSLLRWTAFRVRPGTGPGASGLAFDGAAIAERPAA